MQALSKAIKTALKRQETGYWNIALVTGTLLLNIALGYCNRYVSVIACRVNAYNLQAKLLHSKSASDNRLSFTAIVY